MTGAEEPVACAWIDHGGSGSTATPKLLDSDHAGTVAFKT